MATVSQKGRTLAVKTPLGEDVLLLEGFGGTEAVSRPFRFTLELLSEDPAIDPAALLRKAVTVTLALPDGSTRAINGKIARFIQLRHGAVLHSYRAEMVPWLWFLALSKDCRIFQKKNVLDIIKEIFADYSDADFSIKCMQSYPARDYCVQYRESDLDFISRLMAEEGIFYFFEHSDSGHKLIIADDPSSIPTCAKAEARFVDVSEEGTTYDAVTRLERELVAHTTSVSLTDYDDLQPALNLMSSASHGGFEEVYDYPGKFSKTSEGERYARLRLEALSSHGEVVRGSSGIRAFASGHKFSLTHYPAKDANKAYLLLSVEHRAHEGSYRMGDEGEETSYKNRFEGIPASVPYRPPQPKKKPSVLGSQTAVVVGPSGEEIFTDAHGKVKVQFHWDREGKKDENSSCWVRVSHPWAGKSWGAVAIPRIGQEVIVDFLEGDPDRPIITGRVYNKTQSPPYELPANKTQSGVKSRSSKEGTNGNFNEIRMEDKKGSEQLYIHAEKDKSVVVENDNTESVGHDESVTVGNDQTLSVGENQSIDVGTNRKEQVGSDHDESIGANMSLSVGDNRTVNVSSNLSETVGKNSSLDVGKSRSENIGENLTISVGKNATIKVGAKQTVSIAKDSSHKAKKIQLNADDEISLVTGKASILLKKSGDITIKGKKITVKGSGDLVMKGKKIAQN